MSVSDVKCDGVRSIECSFCGGRNLETVLDLGSVALAGGFLKPDDFAAEQKFPLRVVFCETCFGVQIAEKVDPKLLFSDYFYFSSAITTLRDHFRSYAAEVCERFVRSPGGVVVEFGCNDGVLLRPLADMGIETVIGVDPAANVLGTIDDARLELISGFFDEDVAARILSKHGPADVVMANNVFAHISDIRAATRAVRQVLKRDGVFVFEVHYLGNVIEGMQYDMIYHEHLYYYSLLSATEHFDRHEMSVFDVKHVPVHGGSLRFYVCRKDSRYATSVSNRVHELRAIEHSKGYDRYETFFEFSRRVASHKNQLVQTLEKLREDGKNVAGYGASGRANTVIQYCGITCDHIDYMIDDAPAKIGFFTPGSHLEIRSRSILDTPDRPDCLLVFAWSFLDEICRRNESFLSTGGRLIVPLPQVKVVNNADVGSIIRA